MSLMPDDAYAMLLIIIFTLRYLIAAMSPPAAMIRLIFIIFFRAMPPADFAAAF